MPCTSLRNAAACVVVAVAGLMIASQAVAQKADKKPRISIPFEAERAAQRGDRYALRLNDDATIIPRHRIVDLPVVNGRMGEWVTLDGVDLYFPDGRIVVARTEFQPLRPIAGDGARLEADPNYRHVTNFDAALGPVCARDSNGGGTELRISRERAISVVQKMPAAHSNGQNADSPAYRVTTVLDASWLLRSEPHAEPLYASCLNGGARSASAAKR